MQIKFTGFERFLKVAAKHPEAARRALKATLERHAKQAQRRANNLRWHDHYVRWARGQRN